MIILIDVIILSVGLPLVGHYNIFKFQSSVKTHFVLLFDSNFNIMKKVTIYQYTKYKSELKILGLLNL